MSNIVHFPIPTKRKGWYTRWNETPAPVVSFQKRQAVSRAVVRLPSPYADGLIGIAQAASRYRTIGYGLPFEPLLVEGRIKSLDRPQVALYQIVYWFVLSKSCGLRNRTNNPNLRQACWDTAVLYGLRSNAGEESFITLRTSLRVSEFSDRYDNAIAKVLESLLSIAGDPFIAKESGDLAAERCFESQTKEAIRNACVHKLREIILRSVGLVR